MALPNDPVILLSYVNTQLRDFDSSLEDMCRRLDTDPEQVKAKLATIGYTYDPEANRFQ